MSPKKSARVETLPESAVVKPKFHGFYPFNDQCLHCNTHVAKGDRQELQLDDQGRWRRCCGKCLKTKGGQ